MMILREFVNIWTRVSIHMPILYLCQSTGEYVSCLTRLDQTGNVIILCLHWLVHETEACCLDLAFVVEDDVEGVLLTTNTILLTALTRNFYLGKGSYLVIERQFLRSCRSTRIRLLTIR